jgi:hypothetical protein
MGEGRDEESETDANAESDKDGELSEVDVEWRVMSSKERRPELRSSWSSGSKSRDGV